MTSTNRYKHWLLETTISPPKRHGKILRRQRLLSFLDSTPQDGTILVKGPAGYGKSSLLSDWRQNLLDRGEYCAWLYLDENDDVEMALTHLAYALHLQGMDFEGLGILEAGSARDFEVSKSIKTFLGVIERQQRKVSIILDDTERASSRLFEHLFAPLLRWRPQNLTLVFSGRSYPSLDFGDLALRGLLSEIGPEQLKFDTHEVADLIGDDDPSSAESIIRESDGWPALIQLIRMAQPLSKNVSQHAIGRSLPEIFQNHLDEIILASTTDYELDVLLDAAVFKTIPIAFFENRTTNAQSQPYLLDVLKELTVFVSSSEVADGSLRMHPLLRDRLEARLNTLHPERAKSLHREAAIWFSENSQELPALYHASTAGDLQLIEQVLFKIGGATWILFQTQDHLKRINELIQKSKEKINNSEDLILPLVSLAEIICDTKIGNLDKARDYYNALVARWANLGGGTNFSQAEKQLADFSISLARITLDYYSLLPVDQESALRLVSYEHSRIAATPYLQATLWNTDALRANEQSDFPRSITSAQRAVGKFRAALSSTGEAHVLLLKSAAEIALGRKKSAIDSIASVTHIIDRDFRNDKELSFARDTLENEIALQLKPYNTASVDGYITYIFETEKNITLWFDYYASAILQVLDHYFLSENFEDARVFIANCLSISEFRNLDRLSCFLRNVSAYTLAKSGKTMEAIRTLEANIHRNSAYEIGWRESQISCQLALLLDDCATQRELLSFDRGINLALTSDNKILQLALLFSYAENQWCSDEYEKAVSQLQTACSLALDTGYLRAAAVNYGFLKKALDFESKSHAARSDFQEETNLAILINRLKASKSSSDTNFTEKERLIISELKNGHSDKIIARHLDISPNTVRFHLKNIFKKLGVTSRKIAVEKISGDY